ncbi:MAG: prolyl oligopeptidase family serine peptidase [Desulfobacteraceae bacterium]|nr:prolyl oligopeptidase family serine peptidase [Desulfobacteraceae bacterium]
MRHLSASIANEKADMEIMVWYPATKKAEKVRMGRIEMEVAPDADVQTGLHGLIMISHGTGGSHLGHRDTAIYLASKGYIVVAVLHPHNNCKDNSAARKNRNWIDRPKHISAAMDAILNHDGFKTFIDKDRIGIIGHSAGGYTALAVIGGKPNPDNICAHCGKHGEDTVFCGRPAIFSNIMGWFSSQGAGGGTIMENTHDPRIKAAVLLAPVGVLFNDEHSLARVNVPVRIYRAEKDEVLRYPYHAEVISKKLPEEPEYVLVRNAGHYSFISPFPDSMKEDVGDAAMDPEGFNRGDFHEKMNREIAAFFSTSFLSPQL